jgi:precorrin-6B methylase 2
MDRPAGLERFGIYRHLRSIYDEYIRDRLPRKVGVYNGVPVRDRALFDVTDERPEYEGALVTGIRAQVRTGDRVVVVGGGKGVSTVSAARATGPTGAVWSFEGGTERYDRLIETIELNRVGDWTSARRAIVGSDVDVYGERASEIVDPVNLPACDVLVLDCEGAEIEILEAMDQRPRITIVEAHAFLDSPASSVEETLVDLGYEVVDRDVEYEPKGVVVLTGRHTERSSESPK